MGVPLSGPRSEAPLSQPGLGWGFGGEGAQSGCRSGVALTLLTRSQDQVMDQDQDGEGEGYPSRVLCQEYP